MTEYQISELDELHRRLAIIDEVPAPLLAALEEQALGKAAQRQLRERLEDVEQRLAALFAAPPRTSPFVPAGSRAASAADPTPVGDGRGSTSTHPLSVADIDRAIRLEGQRAALAALVARAQVPELPAGITQDVLSAARGRVDGIEVRLGIPQLDYTTRLVAWRSHGRGEPPVRLPEDAAAEKGRQDYQGRERTWREQRRQRPPASDIVSELVLLTQEYRAGMELLEEAQGITALVEQANRVRKEQKVDERAA